MDKPEKKTIKNDNQTPYDNGFVYGFNKGIELYEEYIKGLPIGNTPRLRDNPDLLFEKLKFNNETDYSCNGVILNAVLRNKINNINKEINV